MDDRLVVAAILGLSLVAVGAFLIVRYVQKRQAFKLRQLGRGKTLGQTPVE
jgi:hypothetical protein